DPPVMGLLAAAAMANGQPAGVVPPRAAGLGLEEGLLGLIGCDLFEGRAGHPPEARRGGLVAAKRHAYTPSKNWIFWPGARVTIALRQPEMRPLLRPRRVPLVLVWACLVRTLTAARVTLSPL